MVLNLQEELQNSGKNELIRELENRLSENEQELLKLREKELQNSKELMALKTQSISKSRVSMLARKSAIMDIIPIEKYNVIIKKN